MAWPYVELLETVQKMISFFKRPGDTVSFALIKKGRVLRQSIREIYHYFVVVNYLNFLR